MRIFLFSLGLGVYSVQLAQALGVNDHAIIALEHADINNLIKDHPFFFDNAPFNTFTIRHYKFPDPRKFIQTMRIYRKIVEFKPDIIHALLSGIYPESFLALWLAHKNGVPIVATVHDTRLHPGDSVKFHSLWLHFKTLSLCSHVIVHGKHMSEDLINNYGLKEQDIDIIPHGNYDIYLDTNGGPPAICREPGQVLMFGRMKKYKGLDVLSKAAQIVSRHVPKLKIIIAGKGNELNQLEHQLKSIPCFEIHNRYIPAGEVAQMFASSSLLVIPYIEASQSGPLHLAYSWGCPVVATKVGAIPESLEHGREGLLVPPNDPEALAEAMIEILNNSDLASRMGSAARLKADTELDWAGKICQKTKTVYQKTIMKHEKPDDHIHADQKKVWQLTRDHYRKYLNREN
jgi:glycosyltransferase involved in cell wall biosynthesis